MQTSLILLESAASSISLIRLESAASSISFLIRLESAESPIFLFTHKYYCCIGKYDYSNTHF